MTKFSDIPLRSIGNTVQLAGGVWAGDGKAYILYFPENGEEYPAEVVKMTHEDWKALLYQSDKVEVEVLASLDDPTIHKAIVRKCERMIDSQVSWNVYRRDGYACRYCGADKVPLTVDHLVTWESGGPSIEENLLTSCRKCNKVRGELPYAQWLRHPYYLEASKKLIIKAQEDNQLLAHTLSNIKRVVNIRNRK